MEVRAKAAPSKYRTNKGKISTRKINIDARIQSASIAHAYAARASFLDIASPQ
jgi:hypothetical protein